MQHGPHKGNAAFGMMAFKLRIRDFFNPPSRTLKETGMKKGDRVVDFGCGPGGFTAAASEIVGYTGMVHAVDISQPALKYVKQLIEKKNLSNVKAVYSDCPTHLEALSVNIVLLYHTLHEIDNVLSLLREFHKILKTDGILSVSDRHMSKEDIVSTVMEHRLFEVHSGGKKTITFKKI